MVRSPERAGGPAARTGLRVGPGAFAQYIEPAAYLEDAPFSVSDFALAAESDAPWPDVALPDEVEAKLIERLVARDERAFNELVQTYGRRVSALVMRMLGNRAEAEDLTQEVFVQVFKA